MKQKLFTLFLALIASVGTTFAARDVVPSDAVLKNYYKTGQLCVCIFVPAELDCSQVVFPGTYNRDASDAWITDVNKLAKFEPVEGYDGWYVLAVNDETPADFQSGKGIQGKPVVLDQDGNFNWAYQVGDVTVIRGGVTVVAGFSGEIDLVGYTKDAPNVFIINALKANANPCTAVYHNYTITVISDGCEGFAVPYLIGSMTDWGFQQMQVNVEKTQELGAPVYYYNFKCAEGTRYQVLSGLKAADGSIAEYPTWDAISYLEQLVDDVWVRYTENGNVDLTTGANVNITFDVRQKNLRWARCAEIIPEDPYTVNVTLTAPAGAPAAGIDIIGSFDGWMGTHMILKNGVYTATVSATPSQVFKFREAGTWDNEILVADPEAVGGWAAFPDTQFQSVWQQAAEKGKMVINLDLSNPTMYRWKETPTGTCGDNLTWTLVESVLTISGAGAMADYAYNTMPWYEYRSSIQSVIITDGVTSIGLCAFQGCSSLTSVTIPNSVTSIGHDAFWNCDSLTSVTIPNSVTSIGDHAFCSCDSLTSVTIGNSVTSIGEGAFQYCSSLTSITIPNSVTTIGRDAFMGCKSLASVTIGNSVTSIGDYAFGNCSSLTSVTIPNCVTSIGNSAFRNCSSLTSVTFEGLRAPVIGSNVFINTNNYPIYVPCGTKEAYLTALNVNNTIDESRVKEPVIASGTCGDNLTWELSCNSVLTVSGTGAMADYEYSIVPWYHYRSSIKSIVIDDGVTSIGNCAFTYCSSLISVTIGNRVTSIEDGAFFECSSLTSITIPNSVTSIGNSAFQECSSLTSITIPNSVTSIGNRAFQECSSLTSVTIPNSVTSIGECTFDGCSSLTSVTIPNSVISIGKYAFYGCSSLTSVNINSDAIVNKAYTSSSNLSNIFGSRVTKYIIGDNVKGIGEYAFYGCSSLTSVTIGNSVTSIGERAFYNCSSLTSVTIGNSVTSIGSRAFYGCSSLTSVTIPNSVTSIGSSAFSGCSKLTSPVYNAHCFAYMPTSYSGAYTIPEGIKQIAGGAFSDCPSLTSITIPNSVTCIGSYAFNGCTSLKSITIPNSITSLYNNTFANCTNLNEIILPASIISIGENVFAGCTKLYDVYCYAMEPPTAYESSFANYNAFLHVPCECQRVYLLDVLFGNFKYIECISSDNTTTDEIVVTPSENEANVIWPTVSGAASYELVIKDKSGNIVCTLIFNANGQLTSIAFNAPSRNGVPAQTQSAGFSFTVTGLDSGTGYDLTLTAKDNSGNAIQTETISFVTTGGNVSTDIDQQQGNEVQSTKVVKDGQVLILRNGKTYTMQGVEVK